MTYWPFVDLENAYDRAPLELICHSLRRKDVPEAYINIIRTGNF